MLANLRFLVAPLHRLLAEGPGLVEVTGLGIRRGERADDVGLLPLGRLAGLRGDADGPLAVAEGVVGARGQQPGEIVEHAAVVGLELHRPLEVDQRRRMVADGDRRVAPAAEREELPGIDLESAGEAPDRLARLLGREIEEPQLADERRILRRLPDKPAEIGDRRRVIPPVGRDQAAEFQGRRMIGVAGQRALEIPLGGIPIPSLLTEPGAEDERLGGVGRRIDRRIEIGKRLGEIPLRGEQPAALEEDVGRRRIDRECFVERLQGLVGALCHEERQSADLAESDVVGLLLDGDVEVGDGGVLVPLHQLEQPARPPDIHIPGGELDGLVVLGAAFLRIVIGKIAEDDMRLRRLERIIPVDLDRPPRRSERPAAIASRQRFQPRHHHLGGRERVVPLHHLAKVAQRKGPHPLPLLLAFRRPLEEGVADHRRPVDERAGVEIVGELPRLLVEPLPQRRPDEFENLLEIVE